MSIRALYVAPRCAARRSCGSLLTFALTVVSTGGLSAAAWSQQTCDTQKFALSSPTARFEDHADGTVTDRISKLMWMRCSASQKWSLAACVGEAEKLDWKLAQQAAKAMNQSGEFFYKDWRIPQLRELATITERQCGSPRINLVVFPNTPADFYWTSSAPASKVVTTELYALSFGTEGLRPEDKVQAHHLRLVRSAQ
jgi:hypothetical protein